MIKSVFSFCFPWAREKVTSIRIKKDGIKSLGQGGHHVLPAPKQNRDTGLLVPALLLHVRINIWMGLDNIVVFGLVLLQFGINQAQAKPDVQHIQALARAHDLSMFDHQRAFPTHHDRVIVFVQELVIVIMQFLLQIRFVRNVVRIAVEFGLERAQQELGPGAFRDQKLVDVVVPVRKRELARSDLVPVHHVVWVAFRKEPLDDRLVPVLGRVV